MAKVKTNAIRILEKNNVKYEIITYDSKDGKIDGISVAEKINRNIEEVYKTLVTIGNSNELYVFVIPVDKELDLKKAAKIVEEKKIEMIHVKDILKYTGYIRGGCSPFGMKKQYKTFVNDTAKNLEKVIVSGGKIGIQVEINPEALIEILDVKFQDIIK
ncbi:Cys-tRNA(Pro) deacylase [Clostridium septicum]|uniref:Cys-tRNA(Pro)/Cys-tRNA(Cys) deacylase n=1 Tax=Clostridium septicum TaxID=1504 RepID=A0A9N7PM85_CLOSE|nr:Cys-tRNA(Pro) deacylase [Clostridium septicum]AYE34787.1 Cys-tRNA(Pro) deacylase [Clostridium septicum]MDU1312711.1 Cys-tRNA(Pro) deacylase [Clostridium septicum]QAS60182.1 Cys-tRNA(Pro) deacylase [Clostridium septicum]UEC20567.1 Cys-tRNA(Pro) deacylase [Clostridium septicum]USS01380.1 Cys-tRNA(Pro) deacylase [Clostridium septicum]